MIISILAFLISIIPTVLIYLWLRKRNKESQPYLDTCKSAFIRGLVCVLPVLGVSMVLWLGLVISRFALKVTHITNMNQLLYKAIYTIVVLAFAEELVKFLAFKGLLKKKNYEYTWADITAFMTIIGLAFGLLEDIPYAIGASPMVMIIRGLTMGHIGYGFIMGWFYGKRLHTGKKKYGVIAFLLPWALHGAYDFSLSPELMKVNDNFAVIGVSLALVDIILLILMFRFFIKARKKDIYNQPLDLSLLESKKVEE